MSAERPENRRHEVFPVENRSESEETLEANARFVAMHPQLAAALEIVRQLEAVVEENQAVINRHPKPANSLLSNH